MKKKINSPEKKIISTTIQTTNKETLNINEENHENEKIENYFDNFKSSGEIYSISLYNDKTIIIGDGDDKTYFYDIKKKNLPQ